MVKINITFKFIGLNNNYKILIYDKLNKIIYRYKTSNNIINIYLNKNTIYKMIIKNNNNTYIIPFFTSCNIFIINFTQIITKEPFY